MFSSTVGVVMSVSYCVALGYVSVLGVLVSMGVVLCFALLAMRSALAHRGLDPHAAFYDRVQRERCRHGALTTVAPERQQQYVDLLTLVEQIERSDPAEARRCELQPLLDYFVQLSGAQQRCVQSLRPSAAGLALATAPAGDKAVPSRRDEIVARRARHRDESAARLSRVVDEIDATDELIRLVAQRVAYASLEPLIDLEVDRRLADLDDYDAALRQLSALSLPAPGTAGVRASPLM
jgi:hypothetical protein